MTLTKLILIIVIICIVDYPLFNLSLKEDKKSQDGTTLKNHLIIFLMLFIVPLIVTSNICKYSYCLLFGVILT
ncbi:hypothetical protein [Succinivibrio dextrinosolvens]|uniref:hypothetical protein n=1 Tax=Succinivibrio dextrinosolvens TaxID=83771 RepID=UPI0019211538|nr:hypothetical protein [Succinivibrio dextrinosolvens]